MERSSTRIAEGQGVKRYKHIFTGLGVSSRGGRSPPGDLIETPEVIYGDSRIRPKTSFTKSSIPESGAPERD